jgi:hypothetical protein
MERTGGKNGENLAQTMGGQLNPPWVEWLMGWPIGWTALEHLGTAKSPSQQQSHLKFWKEDSDEILRTVWKWNSVCKKVDTGMIGVAQLILALIMLTPNHPLNRDAELRADVVGHFEAAGKLYDIPPTLLVHWGNREASLRVDRVGKRGEKGICQAHGKHLATCRAAGLNINSDDTRQAYRDGIYCMAMLMDMDRRFCGSLERGLRRYSTGSCEKGVKFVKRRLRDWRRALEALDERWGNGRKDRSRALNVDCLLRYMEDVLSHRYRYSNLAYIKSGAEHGMMCDPVMDKRGKCVVGKGKQIVVFEDGCRVAVIRRCLRLTGTQHAKETGTMNDKHIQTDAHGEAENRQIHCDFGTYPSFTVESLCKINEDKNSFRVVASTQKWKTWFQKWKEYYRKTGLIPCRAITKLALVMARHLPL